MSYTFLTKKLDLIMFMSIFINLFPGVWNIFTEEHMEYKLSAFCKRGLSAG